MNPLFGKLTVSPYFGYHVISVFFNQFFTRPREANILANLRKIRQVFLCQIPDESFPIAGTPWEGTKN